ncbi:MAG: ABC transporter substrate-binding protein [Lacunisphaera sp.]
MTHPKMKLTCLAFLAVCLSSLSLPAADNPSRGITVGFSQTGAESAWRVANTRSIQAEAEKRGITLKFSDGQSRQENQIRAIRSFVTQHVDAIILAPIVETGWDAVLREAKRAGIPVILESRTIKGSDDSLYVTFIGSNFLEEGRMAAEWLAAHPHGEGRIVELQGEPGSAPANERRSAFAKGIAAHPELHIIDSQSGNFRRSDGKMVMEAMLKKYGRGIDIVYAHNDDMGLGAIQAIDEAGLKPGTDIIVITIDAIREGVQAVVDGRFNCVVECNPMFGPKVFDAIDQTRAGRPVPKIIYNHDDLFDSTNAAKVIAAREY